MTRQLATARLNKKSQSQHRLYARARIHARLTSYRIQNRDPQGLTTGVVEVRSHRRSEHTLTTDRSQCTLTSLLETLLETHHDLQHHPAV